MRYSFKRLLSSPVFITGFAFALRHAPDVHWHHDRLPHPVKANLPYGYELGRVARAIAAG